MAQFHNRTWIVAYTGSVALVILIGMVRIASTHAHVSQTEDEATHINAGLEWWATDTYESEQGNPPLSRIPVALGLYLDGVRPVPFDRRNEVLSTGTSYARSLSKARLGTLVFFLLASLVVWVWAFVDFGLGTALVAVLLFTNMPPVLAHAGLATTDMAATATVPAAIFAFSLWLRAPTIRHSVIFGLALSLAFLAKFSAVLFLVSAFMAILVVAWLASVTQEEREPRHEHAYLRSAPVIVLVASLIFWAGYEFSLGSISVPGTPHPLIDQLAGDGALRDLGYTLVELGIYPAPEAFQGIRELFVHNRTGHVAYVLGNVSDTGFWYFFPVALLVKTPIPFLLFVVAGSVVAVGSWRRSRSWISMTPVLGSGALLASVIPMNINIGLRHILPMFPMLSIVAALGIVGLATSRRSSHVGGKLTVVGLVAWYLASSWWAHPDYLAYFNEIGGDRPEDILVDSDLDWGQDVGRLSQELSARNIDSVHVALFSRADLDNFEWPDEFHVMTSSDRPTGWVAASVFLIKARDYGWLEAHEPVVTVGSSIRLYFIDPDDGHDG